MFKKHHQSRRSPNVLFVMFRLLLSLIMFVVLLGGIYSAYKQFSGLDPLKLDPQAVLSEILAGKIPKESLGVLSSIKLTESLSNQITQKTTNKQSSKQIPVEDSQENTDSDTAGVEANLSFRFLLFADSHSDNINLSKALTQAGSQFPDLKFIVGLGDYTEVGTIKELKEAKLKLDNANLRYFLVPGDHDLWDCRNRSLEPVACFKQVFGPNYQAFTFNNFKFLLLDNSDNYRGIEDEQLSWIGSELEKVKEEDMKGVFVFMHEPLYHPSSDHVMGRVEKSLKFQADGLISQLEKAGTTRVFAGDIHYFSEYHEPKTDMFMTTAGAVTIEKNPQAPRFAVVSVFDDGSVKVEDVEIK